MEGTRGNGRIARHHDVNGAAGHGAGHRVPNSRFDARGFVGDNQHILAVVALEVFGLIGREPNRKIMVVAELELGWSLLVNDPVARLLRRLDGAASLAQWRQPSISSAEWLASSQLKADVTVKSCQDFSGSPASAAVPSPPDRRILANRPALNCDAGLRSEHKGVGDGAPGSVSLIKQH
jgi:hypothetical protein